MDEKRLLKFGLMIAKGVRTHEGWESVVVGKCGRVSVYSESYEELRVINMLGFWICWELVMNLVWLC